MDQGEQVPLVSPTRSFPIRTFRIFGGIQIGFGVACCVISFVGVILDIINVNAYCPDVIYYLRCREYWNAGALLAFDITCFFFAGLLIMTGCLPFFMSENRQNRWRCLNIAFLVCCIVGASFVAPTVFGLGIIAAVYRAGYSDSGKATFPAFVAIFGLVEFVVSIVAASYSCCCSPWATSTRNKTVYVTAQPPVMVVPNTQIPAGSQVAYAYPGNYQSCVINDIQQNPGATVTNAHTHATTGANQPPQYN